MSGHVKILPLLLILLVGNLFGNEQIYTLKKGETLYRISKRYNISVDILQTYNGIKDPSKLKEGTRIKIPSLYTVQKGDTLYSISRQYNVDLDNLMKTNNITDSTRLYVGKKLYIPGRISSPEEKNTAGREALPGTSPSTYSPGQSNTSAPQNVLIWPHPGQRKNLNGKVSGIVINGKTGDKVVSVSSGQVVWVGPYRGFGQVVFIESKNNYIYVYAGNEKTLVKVGESVNKGAEIGRLGMNVHVGIPQLLFLVYHDGKPVDPYNAPRS